MEGNFLSKIWRKRRTDLLIVGNLLQDKQARR